MKFWSTKLTKVDIQNRDKNIGNLKLLYKTKKALMLNASS